VETQQSVRQVVGCGGQSGLCLDTGRRLPADLEFNPRLELGHHQHHHRQQLRADDRGRTQVDRVQVARRQETPAAQRKQVHLQGGLQRGIEHRDPRGQPHPLRGRRRLPQILPGHQAQRLTQFEVEPLPQAAGNQLHPRQLPAVVQLGGRLDELVHLGLAGLVLHSGRADDPRQTLEEGGGRARTIFETQFQHENRQVIHQP